VLNLSISLFARATDNTPQSATVAFPSDFNDFRTVTGEDKDGPLWSPATFTGRRAKTNVVSVCALVLDYDSKSAGILDPGELMDRWETYEHAVHSTYSPGSYRVILPLGRPVTVEEHAALWMWAHGLDPRIDASCKDASRAWYLPTHRTDLDASPVFGYNEGERLGVGRVADLLPVTRPPSRSTSSTTGPALEGAVGHAGTRSPAAGVLPPRPPTGGGADSPYAGIERAEQREDLALIESRCKFMAHVRADAAHLPEPEWYAGLSIVARCKGGDDLAHELSKPYTGYSYDEAEAKYQRAKTESGPRTCREIRMLSKACAGCPLQVTSPVVLGKSETRTPAPERAPEETIAEDLEAAIAEVQAAFDAARVEEDEALVAVEAAKKRLRYLRSPTAIASEEDLPRAVKALGDAKETQRRAERQRVRAEKTLAAARARTSVAGLPPGADPAVWQALRVETNGRPAATLGNTLAILEGDPRWSSRFAYDDFSMDVCVDRCVLPEELGTALTAKLSYDYSLDTKTDLVLECMRVVAKRRHFHPVREWLEGLTWDGTARMEDLMHAGFGASPTEDEQIVRIVGERFLLSMVARIYRPGAQVDTMLVLVGKQGAKKSTALKTLAGDEWYGSTDLDLANKDSFMQLRGKWLYELAEFHSVKKAEASKAKSWMSSAKDSYRAPYAKRSEDHLRQTVMAATTNEDEFLNDPTGSRRYQPVHISRTDLEWIAGAREQLFAEAAVRYKAGEQWWFDEGTDEAQRLQRITSSFQVSHPWVEVVHAYVLGRKSAEPFSAVDVMRQALGRQTGDLTHGEKALVGQILRHQVGCPTAKGPTGTLYRRPASMPAVTGPRVIVPYAAK